MPPVIRPWNALSNAIKISRIGAEMAAKFAKARAYTQMAGGSGRVWALGRGGDQL